MKSSLSFNETPDPALSLCETVPLDLLRLQNVFKAAP